MSPTDERPESGGERPPSPRPAARNAGGAGRLLKVWVVFVGSTAFRRWQRKPPSGGTTNKYHPNAAMPPAGSGWAGCFRRGFGVRLTPLRFAVEGRLRELAQ